MKVYKPEDIIGEIKVFSEELDDEAYNGNAEQRRNALGKMLDALEKQLTTEQYDEAISKIMSIRDKADGLGQDWIIDPEAVKLISEKSDFVVEYLRTLY